MNDINDSNIGSPGVGSRPAGLAFAMRAEVDLVIADQAFKRSPTITKLLRYLIEQTLAGRGHLLKSYTVAVDGLERSSDFDSTDSYARVQMGRLRKMLQGHYAEHGPIAELCIYVPTGHYLVRMGPLATAYPTLYRPLSPPPTQTPSRENSNAASQIGTTESHDLHWQSLLWRYAGFAAAILLSATIAIGLFHWYRTPTLSIRYSPILELAPVDAGSNEDDKKMAARIEAAFNDGLTRFKMSRIRILRGASLERQEDGVEPVYRLNIQIMSPDGLPVLLYLRMNDVRADTLIWSREVEVDSTPASLQNVIAPLIAQINGPHGVIATHSETLYMDNQSGGYPCLIKYFSWLKTRDAKTEKQIAVCFEEPVEEQRLRATVLSARSFFALVTTTAKDNPDAALAKAKSLAKQALAADVNDASARFAMARLAYIEGDCSSALFYTQQAIDANPYTPVFMPFLAAQAPLCGYSKSNELLDNAFLVARAGDSDARLLLALASITLKRPDRLRELAEANVPRDERHRQNYFLTEALLAAALNKTTEATKYWQTFSKTSPAVSKSSDDKLKKTALSPMLRHQVKQYLSANGVNIH